MVTVNKGEWDSSDSLKYKHRFNKKWQTECAFNMRNDKASGI